MLPPSSPCVMPSRSDARPALKAASVMSIAYCMFASSAGDLIIRQPAVTGVASTICEAGDAFARPFATKKRTRSSTPIFAVDTPRSLRIPPTSDSGSSSSCQTRTSFENLMTSRARCSSKPGDT